MSTLLVRFVSVEFKCQVRLLYYSADVDFIDALALCGNGWCHFLQRAASSGLPNFFAEPGLKMFCMGYDEPAG